jgi:hypothetical protein
MEGALRGEEGEEPGHGETDDLSHQLVGSRFFDVVDGFLNPNPEIALTKPAHQPPHISHELAYLSGLGLGLYLFHEVWGRIMKNWEAQAHGDGGGGGLGSGGG